MRLMDSRTVLLIGVPVILGLAVLLVVATTASRLRVPTASLHREVRRADPSETRARPDASEEARTRFEAAKASLEPAATVPGRLVRFGESPVDAEQLGVTRRQFFNRGILATQGLVLGSFGLAVVGFLWPSLTGGFGGKVKAGGLDDILEFIQGNKEPFYVPEARGYVVPYPKAALAKARQAYSEAIIPGLEAGVVALFQKCPHLGCRVPWCKTSQWFECPCHGSKYNRVGEKKGGPAPRGMDRFPVDVGDGTVVINTGIVIQGPAIGTNTTGQEAEGPNCV
jgi:cytochrome b6-f complex iron-sulfur subunit